MTDHKSQPTQETCFAEREHVEQFQYRFGCEAIDHTTPQSSPTTRTRRNDLSLDHHIRNGRCINCDD